MSKQSPAKSRVEGGAGAANGGRGKGIGDLWQPVDIASLAFFRIVFGAIMTWEVWRYFVGGRIRRQYIEPETFFTYFGFDWVAPWAGNGMYWHFVVLGVLGLFILFGLLYRVSAALFFLGFTYVFLIDQSNYLNHFYLVCLVSLLMVFIPAHQALSLDTRWGLARRSDTAPAWALWLLRAQIGLVYFFGGVAKLNGDWLQGEPVRGWLAARTGLPVVGPLMGEEWLAWVFAYGGVLFDLFVAPALLWRRTRPWAAMAAMLFHLTNSMVFKIGIFPWFMIAATTLFFEPDWPRRWLPSRWRTVTKAAPVAVARYKSPGERRLVIWLLCTYLAVQALVPLRHWLYPGDVNWTEEGHRFAWRMKLRDKHGEAQFFVTDAGTGETRVVNPAQHLTYSQLNEMSTRPDMILQFAHHLAAEARKSGATNIQVRAMVKVSLNGREAQLLVDPRVDLAEQARSLRPVHWILPLTEPLRRRARATN